MPNYKVLITTSGIGSRLGELTKNTNKSLVKVAGKEALRYILESYPENMEFVVTVGYLKDQVIDFIKTNYPDLNVIFAEVDKLNGKSAMFLDSKDGWLKGGKMDVNIEGNRQYYRGSDSILRQLHIGSKLIIDGQMHIIVDENFE